VRVIALYSTLWAVAATGLAAQSWLNLTPQERAYLRPEIEVEIARSVRLNPLVAVVLAPRPGAPAVWMRVPAPVVRAALSELFQRPVLPVVWRGAAVAGAEAAALYVTVLVLARRMAARITRESPPPTSPPSPEVPS
jgi:hypothetical protein